MAAFELSKEESPSCIETGFYLTDSYRKIRESATEKRPLEHSSKGETAVQETTGFPAMGIARQTQPAARRIRLVSQDGNPSLHRYCKIVE